MGNCFGVQFDRLKFDAIKSLRLFRGTNGSLGGEEKNEHAISIDGPHETHDDESDEEILWQGKDKDCKQGSLSSVATSVLYTIEDRNGLDDFLHLTLLDQETRAFRTRYCNTFSDFANPWGDARHYANFGLRQNEKWQLWHSRQRSPYNPNQTYPVYPAFRQGRGRQGSPYKKDVVYECFAPLSKEDVALVARALSCSSRLEVLVTHNNSNIDITGEKLQCLRPSEQLNDEVINVYFSLLKERENREPQKFLKCHFFNTFFLKKLISGGAGYNFESVRRWTTQTKLGYCLANCEKIFVPVHGQAHWCLAIINNKDKKFQYLDSMKGHDERVLDLLADYYINEVKDKSSRDIDLRDWRKEICKDIPQQRNGYDCGMFMIKYADFCSRDVDLCFDQRDMPYFRRRTVKEILKLRAE